jgi:SEC-C motif domain protein
MGVVKVKDINCPCDSGQIYAKCCGPLHQGLAAVSAEQLMRSRYSAFVFELHDYLLKTWHASTRPATLADDEPVRWLGLKIKDTHTEALNAEVEFIARYKIAGKAWKLHERSRFVFEGGCWYYVDGDILDS